MKLEIIENGPIVLDSDGPVAVRRDGSQEDQKGPHFLCRCGRRQANPSATAPTAS